MDGDKDDTKTIRKVAYGPRGGQRNDAEAIARMVWMIKGEGEHNGRN